MKNFNDSENWKFIFFYYNPQDARMFVPKRVQWMGTTFNYAHKMSWVWTAVLFIIIGLMLFFLPSH